MNLLPLYDQIIVRKDTPAERSAGGIFIHENQRQPPKTGVVLAVGCGKLHKSGTITPCSVKPGEKIIFNEWAGQPMEHEGEMLLIVTDAEILGVWGRE